MATVSEDLRARTGVRFLIALSTAALMSCTDGPFIPVPPAAIAGGWAPVVAPGTPPGSSSSFALTIDGSTISGRGWYSGEAGPYGAIDVTGSVEGDEVTLEFTYTPSPTFVGLAVSHESFHGRLMTRSDLVGESTRDGLAAHPQSYKKASRCEGPLPCPLY
jgi:hypothetical protein